MNNRFWIGMLFGCVVGAGLELLFAPRQGTMTRRKISETAAQMYERVPLVGMRFKVKHEEGYKPLKQSI